MGEFDRALAKVLVHEGGYVNDPRDPGGATKEGVTQRVYDDYRRGLDKKTQPVKQMTAGERDSIYRMRYWSLVKGDSLPAGVSYVVFDGAVNSGVSQSIKWLQRALGNIAVDGLIGPSTLLAVKDHHNHQKLIDDICNRRLAFLKALKTWKVFGRGWTSRVEGVRVVGKSWASGEVAPELRHIDKAEFKGHVGDAQKAPSKAVADAATGGGIASGTVAAALQTVKEQLEPYSLFSVWVQRIIIALVILGAALALGGFFYRRYATQKKAELADVLDKVPV